MRLKRSDLAREFEEITRQEIKNHNDAVLASNVSIGQLRQTLEQMTIEFKRLRSEYEGFIRDNGKVNEAYVEEHLEVLHRLSSIEHSIKSAYDRNIEFEANVDIRLKEVSDRFDRYEYELRLVEERVNKRVEQINAWCKEIRNIADRAKRDAENGVAEAHACPKVTPEELREHMDQLGKLLSDHKVDVKGVSEELRAFRHDVNYQTKRIERLETHVDRLEKKR